MKQIDTYIKSDKKDPFKEMYQMLTDPLKLAEAQRQYAINKHKEDKQKDTGLC